MILLIAVLALCLERFMGYPQWLGNAIGHPVMWIGALIERLDRAWNIEHFSPARRRLLGVLCLAAITGIALLSGAALQIILFELSAGTPAFPLLPLIALALLASTLLAQRALYEHVDAVAIALETGSLSAGQTAVAQIVGRDPAALDEAGVARAAIESLAENFSDGVVAPAIWLIVGGLPAGMAYKAINTADSMIGHLSPRHKWFGWATARLDDLINLPASRLSALLLVLAAMIKPGASARGAWQAVWRDASRHRSPNAGWPEAAMAGALSLSLAGPRYYDGNKIDDAEMGAGGRRRLNAGDIRQALKLYQIADALLIVLIGLLAVTVMALPAALPI